MSLDGKQQGKVDSCKPAFTPWFPTDLGRMRLAGGGWTDIHDPDDRDVAMFPIRNDGLRRFAAYIRRASIRMLSLRHLLRSA